jgi:hypothetical protein
MVHTSFNFLTLYIELLIMGNTTSNTVTTEIINETVFNAVQKSVKEHTTLVENIQELEFVAIGGNVIIDETSLSQGSTLNVETFMDTDTQANLQADIANDVFTLMETQGGGVVPMFGKTEAEAHTTIENIFTYEVSQEDFMLQQDIMMNKQSVSAVAVGGDVIVTGLTLDQAVEMDSTALMSTKQYAEAINEVSNTVETESDVTGASLFAGSGGSVGSSMIFLLIIAAVVGIVVLKSMNK